MQSYLTKKIQAIWNEISQTSETVLLWAINRHFTLSMSKSELCTTFHSGPFAVFPISAGGNSCLQFLNQKCKSHPWVLSFSHQIFQNILLFWPSKHQILRISTISSCYSPSPSYHKFLLAWKTKAELANEWCWKVWLNYQTRNLGVGCLSPSCEGVLYELRSETQSPKVSGG